MIESPSYQAAACAYTVGVRAFFTQLSSDVTGGTIERGAGGVVTGDKLATQAEKLLPLSADFTGAAAKQLEAQHVAVRVDTAAQLLTKALTDLQISAQLFQAAIEEEVGIPATRGEKAERGIAIAVPLDLEENLRFLLNESGIAPTPSERAITSLPKDLPSARAQLIQVAGDTMDLIYERAGKTGQAAISGLLGLGVSEVSKAACVVGLQIADVLGVAEKVTRLYTLFREFAFSAYNTLIALLGPGLAKTAAQQVLAWVNDVTRGEQFSKLLDKLYETGTTKQGLDKEIAANTAGLEKFVAAIQEVDALGGKFGQQIGIIEKLLKGLRLFGSVPTTVVPQGKVLMAAAYIIIGGYVVLSGADLVDAPRLHWLDRVPGIPRVVTTNLAAGGS